MSNITVFISYSHDSDAHRERVLALSERLREDGIETVLDQYENGAPKQGWPRWMLDQLDAAEFVLVVCTETYYRQFRGHVQPGQGKGVDWEGALITQEIYDSRSQTLKFVPIFLEAAVADWVPEPLRSIDYYTPTSKTGYQSLYDFLLGQAGVEPQPVGDLKTKSRRIGTALSFDEEPSSSATAQIDIARILKYAPTELIGREAETKLLDDAWKQAVRGAAKRPHVLTLVALGGEGKTSLVAKWVAELAHRDWPGCEAAFAWSFYSQGTRKEWAASSDLFLAEALAFFGDPEMAASAQGAFDKGRRLARLVGQRRALLILDGLEPLQFPPHPPHDGALRDPGLAELLKGLAGSSRGLCLVTTRYSLPDLNTFRQTTAPERELQRLSLAAGVALLQSLGVTGSLRSSDGPEQVLADGSRRRLNVFEALVEDVDGHALTLQIMGGFLRRAYQGDIRKRDRVPLAKAVAKIQGGHAFRAMAAYETWLADESEEARRELAVLRLLGLFDRPATADCIEALVASPAIAGLTEPLVGLAEDDWAFCLTGLQSAKLLTVHRDAAGRLVSLDAHPLLREYFAQAVRRAGAGWSAAPEPPEGGTTSEAWREGHRRLYEHLSARTQEGDQPGLEDLQPLYQAVAHGCQAGLQQETDEKVYYTRITRRDKKYAMNKLGAFGSELGAIACFFETPWSRVSPAFPEEVQGWYLNQAAFRLRALGRLVEALEPMRAGLDMGIKARDWKEASLRASNLSELELTLGEVAGAVGDAEQSVTFADRGGDAWQRIGRRAALANARHHFGLFEEAHAGFSEAETMFKIEVNEANCLVGTWGVYYCDFLLASLERTAWRRIVHSKATPQDSAFESAWRDVEKRAGQMLRWAERTDAALFEVAIDHLTLGRAALYAATLKGAESSAFPSQFSHAKLELNQAVSGLRRSGRSDILPSGLLTRAMHRSLSGEVTGPESAQSDLEEAWEIAERSPMPLFQADVHLHRARLFFRAASYPWQSPQHDLAEARRLIEKHGYGRRQQELEDAEAALNNPGGQ